ncbi:MAG TPA: M20/M25/M40 family metallo-hydrolase [Myxococcaceae bacterium]|nr:M20/M25/M40 family metallo-hydrolase [Myxococcaceae bacterium]
MVLVFAMLAACRTGNSPSVAKGNPGAAPRAEPRLDPEIFAMLSTVSERRMIAAVKVLVSCGTRNSCSVQLGPDKGIAAARDWLQKEFSAVEGVKVFLFPYQQETCRPPVTSNNVVAVLPGARADRLIIVGGHYDSLALSGNQETREAERVDPEANAPGANDSGSQTALVLEAARAMASHRFDATVVFIAFAGEEQGLTGSKAFAQGFQKYFPQARIEAVLNSDIVGGDTSVNNGTTQYQFRLFSPGTPRELGTSADGSRDNTSPSRGVMRFVGTWARLYVPAMAMLPQLREDRVRRGGDHQSFIAEGFPGVRFIEAVENVAHQHTQQDVLANIDSAYLGRMTQVVISSAAALARAPLAPTSMTAATTPEGALRLGWTVSEPDRIDHFVVAARAVTENFYRGRVDVGASSRSYLGKASDLGVPDGPFFVSVAAVDAAGHESLFAYPEYRCTPGGCTVPAGAMDVTAAIRE